MDTFLRRVFLGELELQCRFALNAAHQVDMSIQQLVVAEHDWRFFHEETLRGLHSFLTHSSNISKLLWPAIGDFKKKNKKMDQKETTKRLRAEALRSLLGVEGDWLLARRTLRDHLEHFDERLDTWASTPDRKNYISDNIGELIGGVDESDHIRHFDPKRYTFLFRGERYSLKIMIEETIQLHKKAQKALHGIRHGSRDISDDISPQNK